jgi:hypothetical protein
MKKGQESIASQPLIPLIVVWPGREDLNFRPLALMRFSAHPAPSYVI